VLEEYVHELPQQVVERLGQLLADELAGARRRPLERQADREAAALRGLRDGGARLVVGLEGEHDVVRGRRQRHLGGEWAALPRKPDRGQGALADDHRVDELDRDVARVRARRRRCPERQQAAAAREALGHAVAQAGDAIRLRGEETAVRLGALLQERLDRRARGRAGPQAGAPALLASRTSHSRTSSIPSPVRALTSMCGTSGCTACR
jgi:hypothetical protein